MVIGSVPYLNEKPLTYWFNNTDIGKASGIEVIYAPPAELAVKLANGAIDAALVSSFEYLRTTGYRVVPNVSISGRDEILSVRAFSRLPWPLTQTVALDEGSLTSSALLKILLADIYDLYPTYINCRPDLDVMLSTAEAGMIIGDGGMLANTDGLFTIDLGAAWRKLTGLPFVYAVWIGRPDRLTPELVRTLQTAKEWGVTQLDTIAVEQAQRLQCPVSLCRQYLTEIMDYDLGEEELAGFAEFAARCRRHQVLLEDRAIEMAVSRA